MALRAVTPGLWVNPDQVTAVYVSHQTFHGSPEHWKVWMQSIKGEWTWKKDTEEEAYLWAQTVVDRLNGHGEAQWSVTSPQQALR